METIKPATIKALQQGEEQAFNLVYQTYKDLLYLIIFSIVHHEENAKDLLQDTFIKIYRESGSLREVSKFKSWVTLIAKNTALNFLKKLKDSDWDDHYEVLAITELEQSHHFATWHRSLNDLENLIVAYKIVYDYTFDEIAELTRLPLTTTYKIYQKALTTLRREYRHEKP